jgi:hypothetical protein
MELSSEDSLRLNVLLASRPQAIRIDEGRMTVQGLTPLGETTVRLHPNTRPDRYLRLVRELISGQILGSPGGYPVYLKRWTRMGQMRDESLAQLLLLGEPEAVVAAVCSPGLDDELARRAWWAMEDAENARRMLCNPTVASGPMGPVLASYLVDYLPFETEGELIMESVRLVLRPGLLDPERRDDLWRRSARKQAYLVGFLRAVPDGLPEPEPPRFVAQSLAQGLARLADAGNPVAGALVRSASAAGQTWLKTVAAVLAKPPSQDVLMAAFDCLRDYFAPLRPDGEPNLPIEALIAEADSFASTAGGVPTVIECLVVSPEAAAEIAAMRLLSGAGYGLVRPLLPDPTALGTLMRRKLAPALDPILARIRTLRGGVR